MKLSLCKDSASTGFPWYLKLHILKVSVGLHIPPLGSQGTSNHDDTSNHDELHLAMAME